MLKKYGTVAGIPKEKQQFHALKHSIGTHILDAGEDVYFAKDWLRHKNIQNTTIYSKFSTGTRDARARKMFSSNVLSETGCEGLPLLSGSRQGRKTSAGGTNGSPTPVNWEEFTSTTKSLKSVSDASMSSSV